MTQLTELQEMFLLNIAVNEGTEQSGSDIENKIYKKIEDFLNNYDLSNWEIIWGPGVFRVIPDGKPDHVMFLAKDKLTSRYFISISGTSVYSILNWFEDFYVGTSVQWPLNGAGKSVQVAKGSMLAMDILTSMTAHARMNGTQTGDPLSLPRFLAERFKSHSSEKFTLITGGHSLGGAMSPLMALYLKDTMDKWNSGNTDCEICSWPSAGPTVGNEDFKSYYNSRVPNTHRIHNKKDIVPHAWNKKDLQAIKSIYEPDIPKSDCVDYFVNLNIDKVKDVDYVQAGLIDVPLDGEVNKELIKWYYFAGVNFGIQIGYQHVNAYFELLDIGANDSLAMFNSEKWMSTLEKAVKKQSKS